MYDALLKLVATRPYAVGQYRDAAPGARDNEFALREILQRTGMLMAVQRYLYPAITLLIAPSALRRGSRNIGGAAGRRLTGPP